MLRLLFRKEGNAVWISHLDLMRVLQRAFRRAGIDDLSLDLMLGSFANGLGETEEEKEEE